MQDSSELFFTLWQETLAEFRRYSNVLEKRIQLDREKHDHLVSIQWRMKEQHQMEKEKHVAKFTNSELA